jgi:peptidoglycan/LPS O-acetylase OafA/YrhL
VAVLLVVVYHAGLPVPGGYLGVDVFFVISGYVITNLLLRELATTGRIRFGLFYARRIRRLLPALSVVVAVTAVAAPFLSSPLGAQTEVAATGVGAMLLSANIVIYRLFGHYFDGASDRNPLLHTWSLSAEEQFYLVFPLLLAGIWWWGRRRPVAVRRSLTALALAGVATLSLLLWLPGTQQVWAVAGVSRVAPATFYLAPSRGWEFLVGAVVALVISGRAWSGPGHLPMLTRGLGLGLVGVWAVTVDVGSASQGTTAWVSVLGAGLVLAAGDPTTRGRRSVLISPLLVWIGDRSYSWYLWHWPVIVYTRALWPESRWAPVLAAIVSLVPAWVSFRFVEQPLRNVPPLARSQFLEVTAFLVVVPVALCTIPNQYLRPWLWNRTVLTAREQLVPLHQGDASGCFSSVPLGTRDMSPCWWHRSSRGEPVYLVGDSQADHLSEAMIAAAEATDRPLLVVTMGLCPMSDVLVWNRGHLVPGCRQFVEDLVDYLERKPRGTVVLASSDHYVLDHVRFRVQAPSGRSVTGEPQLQALVAGTRRVVERLRASGHRVVVVGTPPHLFVEERADRSWVEWSPMTCPSVRMRSRPGACGTRRSARQAALQESVARPLARAVTAAGAEFVDLGPDLCPGGLCTSNLGNIWGYRDGTHLSVPQSKALAPRFAEVLAR